MSTRKAPDVPQTLLSAQGTAPAVEMDEILSTRQVVQITKHHRCTLFRWIRAGKFPPKHSYRGLRAGWRRSDVLAWLAGEPPTSN